MGRFSATVLDNAIHYLGRLRDTVVAIPSDGEPWKADDPIARIPIEACLAPNVQPAAFEREWHQRHLDVIAAQSVFALVPTIASRVGMAFSPATRPPVSPSAAGIFSPAVKGWRPWPPLPA